MTDTDSGNIVVANATNDLNDTINDVDEDAFSNKKNRGKGRSYLLNKFYTSFEEAEQVIKNNFLNQQWLSKKTTDTMVGCTRWYHCKYKLCPARVQLVMNQAIEGCTILYSDDEHVHVEGRVLTVGIDDKTKEKIAELEALNLKPAQILIQLRNFATKIPSKNIKQYLMIQTKFMPQIVGLKLSMKKEKLFVYFEFSLQLSGC